MIRNLMGMFFMPLFETASADQGGGASTQVNDSGNGQGASATPAAAASSSTSAGAAAGSGGQPSGSADAGEFTYTVDGKTFKVSRDEATALAQKGHDYTRKTQGLAESRKKLESEFSTRVQSAVQQELAKLRQKEGEDPPDPMAEIRTRQDQLEAKMAEDRWGRSMEGFKQKYPLLNEQLFTLEVMNAKAEWDQLEELAQQHQAAREAERGDIFEKIASDDKHPGSAKWRQKIIDDYIAKKDKQAKEKTDSGGGGSPSSKRDDQKPVTDFNEVDKRVLAKLGG